MCPSTDRICQFSVRYWLPSWILRPYWNHRVCPQASFDQDAKPYILTQGLCCIRKERTMAGICTISWVIFVGGHFEFGYCLEFCLPLPNICHFSTLAELFNQKRKGNRVSVHILTVFVSSVYAAGFHVGFYGHIENIDFFLMLALIRMSKHTFWPRG